MSFSDATGELTRIHLEQVLHTPEKDGRLFQLREQFWYEDAKSGGRRVAEAQEGPIVKGEPGNRTDLASVPPWLWSFIGSYGRQSAAAILHDQECYRAARDAARQNAVPAALHELRARKLIDATFRRGLRSQGVPPLRALLMWAFVSVESFVALPILVALVVLHLSISVGVAWAVILGQLSPWLLVLPLIGLAAGIRVFPLMLTLTVTAVVLAPAIVLHLVPLLFFRLIEAVAWIFDRDRNPIVTPTLNRFRAVRVRSRAQARRDGLIA